MLQIVYLSSVICLQSSTRSFFQWSWSTMQHLDCVSMPQTVLTLLQPAVSLNAIVSLFSSDVFLWIDSVIESIKPLKSLVLICPLGIRPWMIGQILCLNIDSSRHSYAWWMVNTESCRHTALLCSTVRVVCSNCRLWGSWRQWGVRITSKIKTGIGLVWEMEVGKAEDSI